MQTGFLTSLQAISGEFSLRGIGISPENLLIAATALNAGMTLVTADTGYFEKIAVLKLENWLME